MMNITDLITSQLMSPDVLGKLSGLIGANESQTKTATSAAVPALLNVFGKMASTNSGADQLAKAMGGLDLGMLGNLAGALGGSQASGLGSMGGSLLTSLLGGGNNLSSLVGTIASFAGMQPGIMKTLLTYLAPMVLGMVAKQFTGKPDASSVSRLFSEQSNNIRGALPKGLSLGDFGSASGRPSEPARHGGHSPEPQSAGLPGWLLPLLALGALGLGWYIWNQNQPKDEVAIAQVERKVGPVKETVTEVVERKGKEMMDTVVDQISIDPKFLEAIRVGKNATELFGGLTSVLKGVTNEETARLAVPELEKLAPMLTSLEEEAGRLPVEEKPAFTDFIGKNLGLLSKMIDTVMALPGVKGLLGPVVGPMVETLTKMSK
ncbi:MAG: DUF937 domain-containing protein [Planctomycetota bacterium]|nr:MAG: DUF937 domain-containing protein [Planctomycetota bacterium]